MKKEKPKFFSPKPKPTGLNGAKRVFAFITHGLFNGPAVERIENSELELVLTTNSIVPLTEEAVATCDKIRRVSIAPLLASAIAAIQSKQSISALWGKTLKQTMPPQQIESKRSVGGPSSAATTASDHETAQGS